VHIPAGEYFCKKIGNAANDWNENNQPYPVILLALSYAMNYTDNLQNNCNDVKIITPWKKIIHSGDAGCSPKIYIELILGQIFYS
jgi:hypothetical protein